MADEVKKSSTEEALFNMGLSNQMYIQQVFVDSGKSYQFGDAKGRTKCLLQIKRICSSEFDEEETTYFDDKEKSIMLLCGNLSTHMINHKIVFDITLGRYRVQSGTKVFYVYTEKLMGILDEFEERLRKKLSPIFFPKSGDKRYALR